MAKSVRDEFVGFLLDFGLWLDWRPVIREGAASEAEPEDVLLKASPKELTLNCRLIRVDTTVTCRNCGACFEKSARAHVVRRLCPECFCDVAEAELKRIEVVAR